MANARPPGTPTGGTPTARIGIDLSLMQAAVGVARASGQAAAREISQAFRTVQNEQRIAMEQARQATAALRTQSSVRVAQARAESVAQQQAARAAANAAIEAQRRETAAFKSELKQREQAARQSRIATSGGAGGFARGVAGAALGSVGGPVGALAGALGAGGPGALPVAIGVGMVELGKAAVEASKTAVAYDRQRIAAVNLAGSQARLNELLAAYEEATGGAVGDAKALADVTNLQAIGFAKNAGELERFVRAARGISIAKSTGLAETVNELALGIANQSTRRFDQLGLSVEEVNKRIAQLRDNNRGMTREAAFQEAVLQVATEKYGALTERAESQATGLEQLSRAWEDFGLVLGQISEGPVNQAAAGLAGLVTAAKNAVNELDKVNAANKTGIVPGGLTIKGNVAGAESILAGLQAQRQRVLEDMATGARPMAALQADLVELDAKIKAASTSLTGLNAAAVLAVGHGTSGIGAPPWLAGVQAAQNTPAAGFTKEQTAIMVDRFNALNDVTRNESRAILETTRDYERQRASTIANYEKQIAREAQDFARQRANAERKFAMSILDVAQDSARQRVKWEADAARAIQEAREERDERIAELRADSAERVGEIEEKFAKDQEKRARDHAERLRDAAASLDAVAIREEQRRFREENQEAKEAHDEQVSDAKESLQKSIDDANKAFAKQEEQQRESLQRRIDEQKANDALRIEEMKAAFEAQKTQEDEERGIRLGRQAEDHQAQLDELDSQQGLRIQQIQDHAQKQRDEINKQFEKDLVAVGIYVDGYKKELDRIVDAAILSGRRYIDGIIPGSNGHPTGFPSLADPYKYVPPVPSVGTTSSVTNSRTSSVGQVNVNIYAAPGQSEELIGRIAEERIVAVLESYSI